MCITEEDHKGYLCNDSDNEAKQTPLIWAAVNGAVRIAVYLIEQGGADIHHKDTWGFDALFHAVQNGQVLLVRKKEKRDLLTVFRYICCWTREQIYTPETRKDTHWYIGLSTKIR
jgi:Ankyrin repeats (3 copies)